MTNYKPQWHELGIRGTELLARLPVEITEPKDDDLKRVWRDIIEIPQLYDHKDADYCYLSSKDYAEAHAEELLDRYPVKVCEWLMEWQEQLRIVAGLDMPDDTPKVAKGNLPSVENVTLYITLRGELPKDLPKECSFATVIEFMESLARAWERQRKTALLSTYVKNHPELKKELLDNQIPSSYASELRPHGLSVSDLVTYYNNTRRIPSICGIEARRLLQQYIDEFEMLPEDAHNCLESLQVSRIDAVGGHMTRLIGCLNREIDMRKARIYLREQHNAAR